MGLQAPPWLLLQEALLRPAPRKLLLRMQLALVWARWLRRPSFGPVALLQISGQQLALGRQAQVLVVSELLLLEVVAKCDCSHNRRRRLDFSWEFRPRELHIFFD